MIYIWRTFNLFTLGKHYSTTFGMIKLGVLLEPWLLDNGFKLSIVHNWYMRHQSHQGKENVVIGYYT